MSLARLGRMAGGYFYSGLRRTRLTECACQTYRVLIECLFGHPMFFRAAYNKLRATCDLSVPP
jgi:hypothetical protein